MSEHKIGPSPSENQTQEPLMDIQALHSALYRSLDWVDRAEITKKYALTYLSVGASHFVHRLRQGFESLNIPPKIAVLLKTYTPPISSFILRGDIFTNSPQLARQRIEKLTPPSLRPRTF